MLQKNHKRLGEKGFASIAIALVLIAVLALLTVGFAQLARREQQNSLNKQLAKQAFYAAESGVNDAYKAYQDGVLTTTWVTNHGGAGQCLDLPLPGAGTPDISDQYGASYSCVLADLQPKTLVKDIGSDGDWGTYFKTVGAAPDHITVSWSSKGSKPPRSGSGFDQASNWHEMAVMQFSLTPVTSYSRNSLVDNTYTIYGYPSTSSGSATYSSSLKDQGKVVNGGCNSADSSCSITINGLPGGVSSYIIHAHAYYDTSHLTVQPFDSSNTALRTEDGQVVIDVTGKAREVLKRIQVHLPATPPKGLPGGGSTALSAQNICKRFTTDPASGSQTDNAFNSYPACDVAH
jgi:Tfp pilus assembly protein PilX